MDESVSAGEAPSGAKLRRLSDLEEKDDEEDAKLELVRFRQQLSQLQAALVEQEREYDHLVQLNTGLQQRLDASESREEIINNLEAKIKDLADQLEEERTKTAASRELEDLKKENEKLQKELTEAMSNSDKELQLSRETIEELQLNIAEHLKNSTEREKILADLQSQQFDMEKLVIDKTNFEQEIEAKSQLVVDLQNQLERLTSSNENLISQNSLLSLEKEELQVELDLLRCQENNEENDTLKQRIAELEAEVLKSQEMMHEAESLKQINGSLLDQLQSKDSQIEVLVQENSKLLEEMKNVDKLKSSSNSLEEQLSLANQEREKLISEFETRRLEDSRQIADLDKKVIELRSELDDIDAVQMENAERIQQISLLKEEINSLSTQLGESKSDIEKLTSEKDCLVAEIQSLSSKAARTDELEEHAKEREQRIGSLQNQIEGYIAEVNVLRTKGSAELEEQQVQILDLQKRIAELEKDAATKSLEFGEESEKLKTKCEILAAELKLKESEVEALQGEKNCFVLEIDELKTKLDAAERAVSDKENLLIELESLKSGAVEAERYRLDLKELQADLETVKLEKEGILVELEKLQSAKESIEEELKTSVDNLKNKIMELEIEQATRTEVLKAKEAEFVQEIADLRKEYESQADLLQVKDGELQRLFMEIEAGVKEIDTLTAENQQVRQLHEEQRARTQLLEEDLASIRLEKEALEASLHSNKVLDQQLQQKYLDLEVQNAANLRELEEAVGRCGSLETDVADWKSQVEELQERFAVIQEKNSAISNKNLALRSELEKSRGDAEVLQKMQTSQLEDLKQKAAEFDQLQEQFQMLESRHGKGLLCPKLVHFYNKFIAVEAKMEMAQEQLKKEKTKFQNQMSTLEKQIVNYKEEIRRLRLKLAQTAATTNTNSQSSPVLAASVSSNETGMQTEPIQLTGAGTLQWQMEKYHSDNQRLRRKCESLLTSCDEYKEKLMKYYNLYHEAIGQPEKMFKKPEATSGSTSSSTTSSNNPTDPDRRQIDPVITKTSDPIVCAQTNPLSPSRPVVTNVQKSADEKLPPPPDCNTN